jgi:hypothetical protein
MGNALRKLLSEIDEVAGTKSKAAYASLIMPDRRYDTLKEQLQTSYHFPAMRETQRSAVLFAVC